MELEIIETDPGVRGDTAQGGNKPAKLTTGAPLLQYRCLSTRAKSSKSIPVLANTSAVSKTDRTFLEKARISKRSGAFCFQDVIEVDTPILSQVTATDPLLDSFECPTAEGTRYLADLAWEHAMKRLLAQGNGAIYQSEQSLSKRRSRATAQSGIHHARMVSSGLYAGSTPRRNPESAAQTLGLLDQTHATQATVHDFTYRDFMRLRPGPFSGLHDELCQLAARSGHTSPESLCKGELTGCLSRLTLSTIGLSPGWRGRAWLRLISQSGCITVIR